MRGDNPVRGTVLPTLTGSPPHAWGQLFQLQDAAVTGRFTPTQSPGTVLVDSFPIIEKLPSHLVEESNRTVPDDSGQADKPQAHHKERYSSGLL